MAVRVSTQPGKATEDDYAEVGIERAQGTITLRTGRLTVQEHGLHVEEDNQTRLIPWSAIMGVSLKKRQDDSQRSLGRAVSASLRLFNRLGMPEDRRAVRP